VPDNDGGLGTKMDVKKIDKGVSITFTSLIR